MGSAVQGIQGRGPRGGQRHYAVLHVHELSARLPFPVSRDAGGMAVCQYQRCVFAPYFHVNNAAANLAPIPEAVPDEAAVYTSDMMSTGFIGAEHAHIPIGGTVAIFAQGPVGLMATVGARLLGAGLVIAVENMPGRQELAKHFGADVVVNFEDQDPVEAIMELTHGQGVDAAIEALGARPRSRPASR